MPESIREGEGSANDESPVAAAVAMSPYATGGGGVTFERKVAVQYLALMLTGLGATELGEGRSVVSVAFQQAPEHSADDLVVRAKRADEDKPSLVLALSVRRSPAIVKSNVKTRKLIGSLLEELNREFGADVDHRVGVVVAGNQDHAAQLASLADLARRQSDPISFATLVLEPGRFDRAVHDRFEHVRGLVRLALEDAGSDSTDETTVAQRTWHLLSRLQVLMPRFESPDESDWAGVANTLVDVSRAHDLSGAVAVRDRLGVLAADYAPSAALINMNVLRRDAHNVVAPTTRRHDAAWRTLGSLHDQAISAVRSQVTSSDGTNNVHIDRNATIAELHALTAAYSAVIVHGESGVGKSALMVDFAAADSDSDELQALVINLRQLPATPIELESALSVSLATALAEMSAPERLLIIDGADGVAEGRMDLLHYMVDAATQSDVRVLALTTDEVRQLVQREIEARCAGGVIDYEIPTLTDTQLNELVAGFPELAALAADVYARELLRRLVVVDLLLRGGVSGVPLTDGDAMQQVWAGLVRRNERADRGMPDAREATMLRLADLALTRSDPLAVVSALDSLALAGLRRDGLLQTPANQPFRITPEFAHDEIRRYAVARLLLADEDPTIRLLSAGMPRWSLGAARLASQLYLGAPDTVDNPVRGRFGRLQQAFDGAVAAGHGERWRDVPGEALLSLPQSGPILADAWEGLCADNKAGLHRLCRLVDQRLRDSSHLVRISAVEPLIERLFGSSIPWFGDKKLQELVREWLRALIAANAPTDNLLRTKLRSQLVARCTAADQRQEEELAAAATARAARTPEEVERDRERAARNNMFGEFGYPRSQRDPRPQLPREITDKVMVEFLALLGPDLGYEGESILRRVADDAPAYLGPAVEAPLAGRALASRQGGFLAAMTEAYYLDDEGGRWGFHEDGIRDHDYHGLGRPLAAWYYGPFISLFQSNFRDGVRVLNRLLNHAALARARTLAGIGRYGAQISDEELDDYRTELQVNGAAHTYIGDSHVWTWYRGTGVGPYPCMSALQALERACDQLINAGIPLSTITNILLDGCESLAMVGLVVGILVRHLEKSDRMLDPYLSEPAIWQLEFARATSEMGGLAASSDGLVGADRRHWSLREASTVLVLAADECRAEELRHLGQELVERARRQAESLIGNDEDAVEQDLLAVRGWASGMDRTTYSVQPTDDGRMMVQSTPPEALLNALEIANVDIRRAQEATRLTVQYYINPKQGIAAPLTSEKLSEDLNVARHLVDEPPALGADDAWDAPAVVVAAALQAHLIEGVPLSDDDLRFAAETLIVIGEQAGRERQFDSEESYFEQGADRIAGRFLPILLLPVATHVRSLIDETDGSKAYARIEQAASQLALALPNEVRVHLARGVDVLWQEPCSKENLCHHETALRLATSTMRDGVYGDWDPETGRRASTLLEEPITESLAAAPDAAIYVTRLDAALRALAPASVAGVCVSGYADDLFYIVLAAQRRALLINERDIDHRGTHALVAARALLTVIETGDATPLFDHLEAFSSRPELIDKFLRAVSAAAEETSSRAATAALLWPEIMKRVLGYQSGHGPLGERSRGDRVRASLIPNVVGEAAYLYREIDAEPIVWWDPEGLKDSVEEWLPGARGDSACVDQLIGFIRVLAPDNQVRIGLSWIADIVLAGPAQIARASFLLSTWLIDVRSVITDPDSLVVWQRVVDALVVAGDSELAPYSQ